MQFPGKLMDQTLKNDKTPNFEPDFGPFGTNLGHHFFFFAGFTSTSSYTLFQVIIQCNYKGKLMNQIWENKKALILSLILVCLTQICAHKIFSEVLHLLVVRYCSNLSSNAI